MSTVIDTLIPRRTFEAMLARRRCPERAELTADLEAHGVAEAARVAARFQLEWYSRWHPKCEEPCSLCCDEVLQFKATKARSLTPEQAGQLPDWEAAWRRIGCDTRPADRALAERAISELYRESGREPPLFFWADSPVSAALAIRFQHFLAENPERRRRRVGGVVSGWLWGALEGDAGAESAARVMAHYGGEVWSRVGAELETRLGSLASSPPGEYLGHLFTNPGQRSDRIDRSLQDHVAREVWGEARDRLWALANGLEPQLRDQLGSQVEHQLAGQLGDLFPRPIAAWDVPAFKWGPRGQHEAHWLAVHTFARDVLDVWYPRVWSKRLDLWADIARSCNRWWAFERLCVISERPTAIRWDHAGRLHGPSMAAVRFRDAYGTHVWHGTWVDASWVTAPERLDPSCALTWPNLEQRRAAAEIIGWQRILDALGPRTVDKHPDPAIGELLEVDLPEAGPARFLKVRCGTGRAFVLSVPVEMLTALQANAWTYGLRPDQFQLEVRT